MSGDAAFVLDALRKTDRDRYLADLVLPQPERDALTALHAFNADVASIRDRAREPAAGEIRLQWWKDALTGDGHGSVRQNPLAAALLDVIAEYALPVPPLTRLLEARRFDLYDDPMPDVVSFEGYAGETVSALYQLGAMILNRGPFESGDAAGHLGVAHALIGHLRAFGFNAARGRIFLPMSVFAAHGVSDKTILAGQQDEGVASALVQLTELAGEHLGQAESAIQSMPRSLRAVFAPIAVLKHQLRRIDPKATFTAQADLSDWRKMLALASWRMRMG